MEKYTTMKIEESFCENKENIVYYIPFIKKESEILTFDDVHFVLFSLKLYGITSLLNCSIMTLKKYFLLKKKPNRISLWNIFRLSIFYKDQIFVS